MCEHSSSLPLLMQLIFMPFGMKNGTILQVLAIELVTFAIEFVT